MTHKIHKKGFTLIEIAIVLVIIGVLVGMGAGLVGPLAKKTKLTDTRNRVQDVHDAIIGYTVANKVLPSALSDLSVNTKDAYTKDLLYYAAAGITAADLCTTQGTYLTLDDKGTTKNTVAFIILSTGENVCDQTTAAVPYTISDQGVNVSCPQDSGAGYDDIVLYQEINFLREKICNTFRIVTDTLPVGTEEFAYPSTTIQATDGTTAYTWSVSGTIQGTNGCGGTDYPIDPGITTGLCVTAGGVVSGTPILDGVYALTLNVTDVENRTASKSLSITVNPNDPQITTLFFHRGTENDPYTAELSASGGDGSYSWNLQSGALPFGLNLVGSSISGTPTTAGTYSFTLRVTDGRGRTASKTLSITIEASGGGGNGNGNGNGNGKGKGKGKG